MADIPGPGVAPVAEPPTAVTPPTTGPRPAPSLPDDWPAKAADTVDLVVALVSDRAVRPVVVAARAVVFGVLIALTGLVVLVAVSIALVRLLDVYAWPGLQWLSYFVLAALFLVGGLAAWSQRAPKGGA